MRSTRHPSEHAETDADLIRLAVSGDERGYEGLALRYRTRLHTSIGNDVGCPVMAEDIVQEAFVRAFVHLASFRGQSNFYTWLYRIALNSRRSYLRKNRITLPLDADVEVQCHIGSDSPDSPARRVERSEECVEVRDALARLEEHHRTILILREFEGFDYQKIAETLDVKMGTVRSRLARARNRLRKELRPYFEARPTDRPLSPGKLSPGNSSTTTVADTTSADPNVAGPASRDATAALAGTGVTEDSGALSL